MFTDDIFHWVKGAGMTQGDHPFQLHTHFEKLMHYLQCCPQWQRQGVGVRPPLFFKVPLVCKLCIKSVIFKGKSLITTAANAYLRNGSDTDGGIHGAGLWAKWLRSRSWTNLPKIVRHTYCTEWNSKASFEKIAESIWNSPGEDVALSGATKNSALGKHSGRNLEMYVQVTVKLFRLECKLKSSIVTPIYNTM